MKALDSKSDAHGKAPSGVLKTCKYIWVFPVTFFGLIIVGLTAVSGGSVRVDYGVIEAGGGFAKWLIEHALLGKVWCATLGHVIIGLDCEYLERMRAHELIHVQQYERWGILFIPLYIASSLWAWSQGKHRYRDNVFEREAYAKAPQT